MDIHSSRRWRTASHLSKERHQQSTHASATCVRTSQQVTIIGAAKGDIESLQETNLTLDVSGNGELRCSGNVTELTLNSSGSGKFDCEDLIANNVKITVTGNGDAVVHAVDSLNVNISGSGSVQYIGDPEIKKQVTGSGTIKPFATNNR